MNISTQSFTINNKTYKPTSKPYVVICLDGSADEYLDTTLAHDRMPNLKMMARNGYRGLHELLSVTRDMRRLIQTGARVEELLRQGLSDGMRTLRQDGIERVLAGETTIAEVRSMSNA